MDRLKKDGEDMSTNTIVKSFKHLSSELFKNPGSLSTSKMEITTKPDTIRSITAILRTNVDDENCNNLRGSFTYAIIKGRFAATPAKAIINCTEYLIAGSG